MRSHVEFRVPLNCDEDQRSVSLCLAWQVQQFWKLMEITGIEGAKPSKVTMHADAWGIRKLTSYALRSLRLQRVAREPCLRLSSHVSLLSNSKEDDINTLLDRLFGSSFVQGGSRGLLCLNGRCVSMMFLLTLDSSVCARGFVSTGPCGRRTRGRRGQ